MQAQVNEKLYFARWLLDQADQSTEQGARTALLQSAVLQLAIGYRCYLREIAERQRLEISADTAFAAAARLSDRVIPELSELAALEQADAWPARLLAARDDILEPSPGASRGAIDAQAIQLTDVTRALAPEQVRQWLSAFQRLLEGQREQAQEW